MRASEGDETAVESARVKTPQGDLVAFVREGVLVGLGFSDHEPGLLHNLERRFSSLRLHPARDPGGVATALEAYVAGDVRAIDGLPIETGGTDFQRRVWRALRDIPAGETRTYAELARAIGRPTATRAVGAANGQNPVSIVVPCHRVIGKRGTLTGYGGGLDRKRWLLEHEARSLGLADQRPLLI